MSSSPTCSSSHPSSIPEQQELQLDWHHRKVHMLCIAGTIRTGLFVGTRNPPAQGETDIGFESIWEPDGPDMDGEDADGEELFETCSEGSASASNSSAGARNPGGSEQGTAGSLPLMREDGLLPPPPTGSTKNKSNRRKKKSKKGKKKNPVPVPIVGLPSQQAEEHYPSTATPTRTVHIAAIPGALQGPTEQGKEDAQRRRDGRRLTASAEWGSEEILTDE